MPETSLALAEAVQLGHALIARVAQDCGSRALLIKGPILAIQGLRLGHRSIDVDVLVDPSGFGNVCRALEELGWESLAWTETPHAIPMHSVTYAHESWPCEIDVHHQFPGFLADPRAVFEALWERRATAVLAGQEVPCCDQLGNALIAGLHILRTPGWVAGIQDFDYMVGVLRQMDEGQRQELAELAARTGAATTGRPLLDAVGAPDTGADSFSVDGLAAWRLRRASAGMNSMIWAVELAHTPLRSLPAKVWRVLWLTEPEIRRAHPQVASGTWGLLLARLQRLGRGLRSLPGATARLWRLKHERVTA